MRRPVREGHLTVNQAITEIIHDRFADRDKAIEQQTKAEEDARKREIVSSGDLLQDALIHQPSYQLQKMINDIFTDGQYILRQWLCDGKIHAFYRDPIFGRDVEVDSAAWELETTDEAIGGGKFYPYGRAAGRHDPHSGAPVKLLRSDLERLLDDGPPAARVEDKPKVGAPETAVLRVIDAMLKAPRDHWDGATYESMAATFGASPATVKKARERVLQQLAEKGADN